MNEDRKVGRMEQGSQGSQLASPDYTDNLQESNLKEQKETYNDFDLNTTQTNALLQMRDNKFNLML